MVMYFPWWLSALALAWVTISFWLLLRRPLGVSGSWARVLTWRDDRKLREAEAPFLNNPTLLKDALMAATIEEFGKDKVMAFLQSKQGEHKTETSIPNEQNQVARTSWTVHLAFLIMLVVGGVVATIIRGDYQFSMTLGQVHTDLFGTGMGELITLFTGGIMVGFGTQMAGGCTSGHGLSGMGRLSPASMLATATFFGSAIVVSMLAHYFHTGAPF